MNHASDESNSVALSIEIIDYLCNLGKRMLSVVWGEEGTCEEPLC